MLWAHLLAYVTGTINQKLLLRNEYLTAENRILRGQIKGTSQGIAGNRTLGRADGEGKSQQYIVHYHEERNHQGKGSRILFPSRPEARRNMGAVRCRERLGGLLKYHEREAA